MLYEVITEWVDYKSSLQSIIIKEVMDSIDRLESEWIPAKKYFKWFMIESYLYDGRQDYTEDGDELKVQKWCSLTDPCSWKEATLEFVNELYNRL